MEALTKEEIKSLQATKNSFNESELFLIIAEFCSLKHYTLHTFYGDVKVFDFFDKVYLCESERD